MLPRSNRGQWFVSVGWRGSFRANDGALMKLSAWREDASLEPQHSCKGRAAPADLARSGEIERREGVNRGGESRSLENVGRKSSGGMLGGAVLYDRYVPKVP
jgi:hypothetical protein